MSRLDKASGSSLSEIGLNEIPDCPEVHASPATTTSSSAGYSS
jgi:hypothetical protein